MKTHVFVILILICSCLSSYSQNRIHSWDTEKITSIEVELTSPDDETEILVFKDQQDMDAIISFLKAVEFREWNGSEIDEQEQKKNWRCKIFFQGQRDQVYLFSNSGCIGKTTFLIDGNVINDFKRLVQDLVDIS